MRHRYFIDSKGPLFQKMLLINGEKRAAEKTLRAFVKEIGATRMYGNSPAGYVFDFATDKDADTDTWSKTKPVRGQYFFRPRRNSTAGKAMAERIKQLPDYPSDKTAIGIVPGLSKSAPAVFEGNMAYWPFIRYFSMRDPEVIVLSVPWQDVDPKTLAAYVKQANSKKRHSWDSGLDFAQWTPPEWLREIKEWEAERLVADGVMP